MKLDILAFGAHPDDIELAASGTLLKHIEQGKKVGIVDLTLGELGTKGTAKTRMSEAHEAAKILKLEIRENLQLADGFFEIDETSLLKVVHQIRKYKPEVVICNAVSDRHPDHGRGGDLISRACFLSGLIKIGTQNNDGSLQDTWRPKVVYRYIQDNWINPDFVVDITPYYETKMKSVMAYKTQFYNPEDKGAITPISSPEFLEFLNGRAANFGRIIGAKYGEGFTVERSIGVNSFFDLK
jgi:bacillithiol biosynthesis deacetylase BshB1